MEDTYSIMQQCMNKYIRERDERLYLFRCSKKRDLEILEKPLVLQSQQRFITPCFKILSLSEAEKILRKNQNEIDPDFINFAYPLNHLSWTGKNIEPIQLKI